MKNTAALLMALGLALPAMTYGQDANEPRPRRDAPRPREEGGLPPRGDGQRPPVPPLVAALDANHDGVIDEDEINNAPKALRKLDKNGDGKLTLDELRPQRPDGARDGAGPGFGPRGNRGDAPVDGPRPRRNAPPGGEQ